MTDGKKESPVIKISYGIGEGVGCALIILALAFSCGGGCVIVDKVFDRLERYEAVKQGNAEKAK